MSKQQQDNYSKVMQWLLDDSSKSNWQKFMEKQIRDYLRQERKLQCTDASAVVEILSAMKYKLENMDSLGDFNDLYPQLLDYINEMKSYFE